MIICTECGWEIPKQALWGKPICDDCAMDMMIQHNKEQGILI